MKTYEYGILTRDGEVHREGMTELAAQQWLDEWFTDGGAHGAFFIIRRPIGQWEVIGR